MYPLHLNTHTYHDSDFEECCAPAMWGRSWALHGAWQIPFPLLANRLPPPFCSLDNSPYSPLPIITHFRAISCESIQMLLEAIYILSLVPPWSNTSFCKCVTLLSVKHSMLVFYFSLNPKTICFELQRALADPAHWGLVDQAMFTLSSPFRT